MQDNNIANNNIDIDDIKMLINQKEGNEYKIMSIDINSPSISKYRLEFSYSQKFKKIIEPLQEELLRISEDMYNKYKDFIYNHIKIPENIIYTMLEVSISSNVLCNYITLDIPLLRLLDAETEKADKLYLKYIVEKAQYLTNQLTANLYSVIDGVIKEYKGNDMQINEFEFIMYYDSEEMLYNDFIPSNIVDCELEKYNIFKLAYKEDLFEKLENAIFKNYSRLASEKFYKVSFCYEKNQVKIIQCLPWISNLAHSS